MSRCLFHYTARYAVLLSVHFLVVHFLCSMDWAMAAGVCRLVPVLILRGFFLLSPIYFRGLTKFPFIRSYYVNVAAYSNHCLLDARVGYYKSLGENFGMIACRERGFDKNSWEILGCLAISRRIAHLARFGNKVMVRLKLRLHATTMKHSVGI